MIYYDILNVIPLGGISLIKLKFYFIFQTDAEKYQADKYKEDLKNQVITSKPLF